MYLLATPTPMGLARGTAVNAGLDRIGAMVATVLKWLRMERGNISALVALMLVPLIGVLALGTETSSWYFMQRSQQNAADSASPWREGALNSGSTSEAATAAKAYGYTDNTNGVRVTATSPFCCPSGLQAGTSTCFQVVISRNVPIYLTRFAGFQGDATSGTGKFITASAISGLTPGSTEFCLIALSGGISFNGGGAKPTFAGCSFVALGSSGNISCSGSNFTDQTKSGIGQVYAGGKDKGPCGTAHDGNTAGITSDPKKADIGQAITKDLPATCPTATSIGPSNLSAGANCFNANGGMITWTGNGTNTINTANTTIFIKNGGLNLNGNTLRTGAGGSAALIFTGSAGNNAIHPRGRAIHSISPRPAPEDFAGVAIVGKRRNGTLPTP